MSALLIAEHNNKELKPFTLNAITAASQIDEDLHVLVIGYNADEVVKSIQKSDLGFNPNNDDGVIIINVPPLTQERRQELVKFLNKQSEAFKISVRNVRKEANDEIKKSLKNKEITEDQEKSGLKKIQDQTDIFIQKISDETSIKEKEITNI